MLRGGINTGLEMTVSKDSNFEELTSEGIEINGIPTWKKEFIQSSE